MPRSSANVMLSLSEQTWLMWASTYVPQRSSCSSLTTLISSTSRGTSSVASCPRRSWGTSCLCTCCKMSMQRMWPTCVHTLLSPGTSSTAGCTRSVQMPTCFHPLQAQQESHGQPQTTSCWMAAGVLSCTFCQNSYFWAAHANATVTDVARFREVYREAAAACWAATSAANQSVAAFVLPSLRASYIRTTGFCDSFPRPVGMQVQRDIGEG